MHCLADHLAHYMVDVTVPVRPELTQANPGGYRLNRSGQDLHPVTVPFSGMTCIPSGRTNVAKRQNLPPGLPTPPVLCRRPPWFT